MKRYLTILFYGGALLLILHTCMNPPEKPQPMEYLHPRAAMQRDCYQAGMQWASEDPSDWQNPGYCISP